MLAGLLCSLSYSQNQLQIPDTISGSEINLNLRKGNVQFYPGKTTATLGVNGDILGPTLMLTKHKNVTINVKNNLGEPTTIHWHGMHVAPHNDGGPHVVIDSGKTWSPSFEVLDYASTHWYHPHLHMKTNEHVQKGIAGFIIVRDSAEARLNLPRTYGVDDFPLVVQTKVFDANHQIITGQNAMDTALMVNATLKPFVNMPAQVVRLRLLNGSSERVYHFGFKDNRSFSQIGSDGGLLEAPVTLTRLLLAPGERAEILVNLTGLNGSKIFLKNYGQEISNAIYGAAQPGMGAGQQIPNYTSNFLNGKEFNILEIRVTAPTSNPVTSVPAALVSVVPIPSSQSKITRQLVFTSMTMGPGAINGPFLINGSHFDMNTINYRVPFNNTEIWELRNQTPIAHPFHIHNVHFFVLSVNGSAPPVNQRGRKDVILVPGGNSTVQFIARFEDFYNDSLPYMYHCHMLTHEDDGMMGQFIVEPPCDYIKEQPANQLTEIGGTARFSVLVNDTTGISYQWQSNVGFGFQNLDNAGQYSGVKTAQLTVSDITLSNNNQLFRCNVTKGNCEEISDVATIKTISLGNPVISKSGITAFPNPTNGLLNIQAENAWAGGEIVIYSMQGNILRCNKLMATNTVVDLAELPPGLYHLSIVNGDLRFNTLIQR